MSKRLKQRKFTPGWQHRKRGGGGHPRWAGGYNSLMSHAEI